MKIRFDPSCFRETRWWEYLVRFAFGGLITVLTGVIAQRFGPVIGGLFLAFPAILPASLTLVKKHDGRAQARDDARGAAAGCVGLLAAALVVWQLAGRTLPVIVLAAALVAWFATSYAVWLAVFGRASAAPPDPVAR